MPIGDWFRGELRDLARDVLLDSASLARGYFRPEAVRAMLDRHSARRRRRRPSALWALFMFELWHREFVDRADVDAPSCSRARQ